MDGQDMIPMLIVVVMLLAVAWAIWGNEADAYR